MYQIPLKQDHMKSKVTIGILEAQWFLTEKEQVELQYHKNSVSGGDVLDGLSLLPCYIANCLDMELQQIVDTFYSEDYYISDEELYFNQGL